MKLTDRHDYDTEMCSLGRVAQALVALAVLVAVLWWLDSGLPL